MNNENPLLNAALLGRGVRYYDCVDSTNRCAKQLAAEGAPHMTLVLAEAQTEGRGRRGRAWLSRAGVGVWMSLIVRPDVRPDRAAELVMVTAVALCGALSALTGKGAQIKWPNDVHFGGKKLSGTLLETGGALGADASIEYAVIGVGINVIGDEFPPELPDAASIESAMGITLARSRVVECFMEKFERLYARWEEGGLAEIMPHYREQSSTLGKAVRAFCPDGEWIGVAEDIAADGALLLREADGRLRPLYAGDVSIRDAKTP